MILVKGDLWEEIGTADYLLVTTNATIKKDGRLVMGRGAALQAREQVPELDLFLGQAIRAAVGTRPVSRLYGVVFAGLSQNGTQLGAFQVKYHFSDPARLEIIAYAAGRLHGFLLQQEEDVRVALNFPGIGYGGLPRETVLPLLENLPDNVVIYEYPAATGGRGAPF